MNSTNMNHYINVKNSELFTTPTFENKKIMNLHNMILYTPEKF